MKDSGISVVIPVFNEKANLSALREELTDSLKSSERLWEVVFVNDGSTDGSQEMLDSLAESDIRFKVVHLRRNFGQTAAIMAGIDHCTGNIIVTMDADLQNDPADINHLLRKLDEGCDVVSGWRFDRRDKEWGRRWPSEVANSLLSWLFRVKLHDFGCTLKAYRRWTIENVNLYGEMHRYIPIYASWQGARVAELPVNHRPRLHGASKYGMSRIPRVVLDLLVMYFFDRAIDRPMQFFGRAGLVSLLGALLAGMWALWLRLIEGVSFILTPLPLLVALLLICALLCFFFGVLAEMQMRTYFESRDKRAYIVRETRNLN
jgi:glycosyltransferase involved in cell wall biosynthesis